MIPDPIVQTDPATAYAEAVCAGELVTGRLVRLACERHLSHGPKVPKPWPTCPARSRRSAKLHHQRGGASPNPIRCTNLSRPAKPTPI